jgi:hypothetical protein
MGLWNCGYCVTTRASETPNRFRRQMRFTPVRGGEWCHDVAKFQYPSRHCPDKPRPVPVGGCPVEGDRLTVLSSSRLITASTWALTLISNFRQPDHARIAPSGIREEQSEVGHTAVTPRRCWRLADSAVAVPPSSSRRRV